MMARIWRFYILVFELGSYFYFFFSQGLPCGYRNTRESLRELEKAVKTLAYDSCSHCISRFPNFPFVFL